MRYLIILLSISNYIFALSPPYNKNNSPVLFKDNHPASWTVNTADTPWKIARLFLANPWRWEEAWNDQPAPKTLKAGDVISIHREQGKSFLVYQAASQTDANSEVIKLGPEITATPLTSQTAPTKESAVNLNHLTPFLNQGYIFDSREAIDQLPQIMMNKNRSIFSLQGSTVYAKMAENTPPEQFYHVFRQQRPYVDTATGKLLGIGSEYIGQVHLKAYKSDLMSLEVQAIKKEIRAGDILLSREQFSPISLPSAHNFLSSPAEQIKSKVIASVLSTANTGRYGSIVVDGGKERKLAAGQVFLIYKSSLIPDASGEKHTAFVEDKKPVGRAMIYRTFKKLSYALILEASTSVKSGDILKTSSLEE